MILVDNFSETRIEVNLIKIRQIKIRHKMWIVVECAIF